MTYKVKLQRIMKLSLFALSIVSLYAVSLISACGDDSIALIGCQ